LKLDLQQETSKVSQLERAKQLLEVQVNSLQTQLNSLESLFQDTERQLGDALDDIRRLEADHESAMEHQNFTISDLKSQV
jgi:peptidoglycan hydrolase CwlO-like protein